MGRWNLFMPLWEGSGDLGAVVFPAQLIPENYNFLSLSPLLSLAIFLLSKFSSAFLWATGAFFIVVIIYWWSTLTSWRKRRTERWPWSYGKRTRPGRTSPCRRSTKRFKIICTKIKLFFDIILGTHQLISNRKAETCKLSRQVFEVGFLSLP